MARFRTSSGVFLIGHLLTGWAQADHGPSAICAQVSELEALAEQAEASDRSSDPTTTAAKLVDLHGKLPDVTDLVTLPSAIAARNSLRGLVAQGREDHDALFAQRVTQVLLDHQAYFAAIKASFDCDAVVVQASGGDSEDAKPETARAGTPLAPKTPEGEHRPLIYNISLVFLSLVLLTLLRRSQEQRRSVRHICHTPTIMQSRNRCTKTYIVDISDGGMRIEAPAEGNEGDDIDLFFCGRRLRGRIMWRNTYFAGVQLGKSIDERLVHEVVAATVTKSESAQVPAHTLPCHTPDCHRSCRLHHPTALSMRQVAAKAMARRQKAAETTPRREDRNRHQI